MCVEGGNSSIVKQDFAYSKYSIGIKKKLAE